MTVSKRPGTTVGRCGRGRGRRIAEGSRRHISTTTTLSPPASRRTMLPLLRGTRASPGIRASGSPLGAYGCKGITHGRRITARLARLARHSTHILHPYQVASPPRPPAEHSGRRLPPWRTNIAARCQFAAYIETSWLAVVAGIARVAFFSFACMACEQRHGCTRFPTFAAFKSSWARPPAVFCVVYRQKECV